MNSNKLTYYKNIRFYYLAAWKLSGRQNRSMVYTSKVLNGRRWCWQRKLSQRRMSKYKSTKKYSKTWARGHCIYSFSWECQGNIFESMQYGLNIVYIWMVLVQIWMIHTDKLLKVEQRSLSSHCSLSVVSKTRVSYSDLRSKRVWWFHN